MRLSALFASYFAGYVFLVDLLLVFRLSFSSGIPSASAIFVGLLFRLASKNPSGASSAIYSAGGSLFSTIKEARSFSPPNDFSGSYRLTSCTPVPSYKISVSRVLRSS